MSRRRVWIGRQAGDDEDTVFVDDGSFNAWENAITHWLADAGVDPREWRRKQNNGELLPGDPEFFLNFTIDIHGDNLSVGVADYT